MSTTKQTKQSRRKKIKRNMSTFNIIFGVIVVLTNFMFGYIIFNLNKFSNLSKPIFIVVNIFLLLLLLTLNIIYIITVRTKLASFFNTLIILGSVLAFLAMYGTYVLAKVNINIDKIVQSGEVSETVETSFVVFSESGDFTIEKEEELEGKVVGVAAGTTNSTLAMEELKNKNINVTFNEFNDNNELLLALFNNNIDAAALPSNYVGIFEVNDGYGDLLKNTKAIATFSSAVKVDAVKSSDKDITKEPFTVLVLGVDEGRSDAVILASFNPISMKLTMTSIPRDSYVPIACYPGQSSDKLGHARVRSRQCTIDTISKLMGIEIDYYFESNFKGIVEMVNALGGIVVNNPYEFVGQSSSTQRGHYTVWVPAGSDVPLNGEQALAFARERHLYASGDFQRQANQQQVIKAILTKAMRTADLNKLLNVLDAAGENVSTNLTVNQLIDLFNHVMKKAGRYYDDSHLENVIQIQGSRVTGYNSGIWNESLQLTLSIIRLYEGSIKDNRTAILRNLDVESAISAPKSYRWDANWVFNAPTVSNETYSEKIIKDETPDVVLNFVGKNIDAIKNWAASRGITINISPVDCAATGSCGGYGDNIIISQSVRAGIKVSNVTDISVEVTTNSAAAKPSTPATGQFDVIVRYRLDDGGPAPQMYQGKTDQNGNYSITSPSVPGYTPDVSIVQGTAYANVDVTVTYKKNAVTQPITEPEPCPDGTTGTPGNCVPIVQEFNYTINYIYSGTTIYSSSGKVPKDKVVNASIPDGYVATGATSFTVTAEGQTFDCPVDKKPENTGNGEDGETGGNGNGGETGGNGNGGETGGNGESGDGSNPNP